MTNSFKRVSRIHELFFSLNVAWLAVWYELWRGPSSALFKLGGLEMRHRYWLRISGAYGESYGVLEQVFWSIVFAAAIFVIFVLLKWIWTPGLVFRVGSGIIALTGFPLIVLYFLPFLLTPSIHVLFEGSFAWAFMILAVIEISAATFCEVLYLLRKWPLRTIPTMSLVLVHFGLWAWVAGVLVSPMFEIRSYHEGRHVIAIFISTAYHLGLPVLGLLASISWGRYVREIRDSQSASLS